MFIGNKRNFKIPNEIVINMNRIQVAISFKLLCVTKDNKFTFIKYVTDLRYTINKRPLLDRKII